MGKIRSLAFSMMIAAVAAAGCAKPMVAPPPRELRAELDVVGLVTPTEPTDKPLESPTEPVKGTVGAALTGAGQGAAGTFLGTAGGFCQVGDPYACAFGIVLGAVLTPVGAVVGAGVGAAKSHSAEEVEGAQSTLVAVVAKVRPNGELTARVAQWARQVHGLRTLPVTCPRTSAECTAAGAPKPKYALRIEYASFDLRAFGRIDPDLSVAATVEASIFDLASGEPAYERQWGYRSPGRPYFDLAEDAGAGLEALIEASHEAVATQVLHDLFAAEAPSPVGRAKAGTVWTIRGPLVGEAPPGAVDAEEEAPREAGEDVPEAEQGGDWVLESCSPFHPAADECL